MCVIQLTLFFGHPEAAHQLLQRKRLVVADVTVLHKLLHALLRLGFLAQEAFERLDLLLPNVTTRVFVQLTEEYTEGERGFVTQDTYTIFQSPRGVVVIIDTVSSTLMDYGKSILV